MTNFVDDLPLSSRKGRDISDLKRFATDLQANPGRWAVYPRPLANQNSRQMTASMIRNGRTASFPQGFEATVREGELYVRYAG